MAKLIVSDNSIIAQDKDGLRIIKGFKTLVEKVPENDLLILADLMKDKPHLLQSAIPWIEKLKLM